MAFRRARASVTFYYVSDWKYCLEVLGWRGGLVTAGLKSPPEILKNVHALTMRLNPKQIAMYR